MKNRFLKIFILFIFVQPATAQKLLTVEEAIAAALQNNYDIQLLKNDSTAFAIDKSYAKYALYPRVNGNTGLVLNNNSQKQKLADGSIRKGGVSSDNITASVALNWTVFDGFKMFATRDKQAEFVKLGELTIKNQIVNTVAAVVTNYYNIVRQKQQQKAIEEQMGINQERLKQAEKRFSVGLGAKPDILQAKTDLNAQKASLLQQQTFIEQLKEQLNLLMAAPINTTYNVTDSIPINNNLVITEILSVAENNNPALQVAKQNIIIANFTLKERKAERYPTVSLNSAYNFGRLHNQKVLNNFTPILNRNLGFNYGLSATIPIFNGYNTKRQIQQAQLAIDRNKLEYEKIKAANQIAISNAFKTYELQKKTLALEEENILLAKENVFIAMERFKLGISTTLELRETQKTLEDAFNRLIAARYNTKIAETELLRLKGDLVK
ncbi:MAG: TolC family protein [Ferruginibacter sp.]|nr:TolC family protein [Ferruginibacter sp.]